MSGNITQPYHYLLLGNGSRLQFTDNNGVVLPRADINVSVVKNSDSATQTQWLWEVIRENDSHERYNSQGLLVAEWPRQGELLATTYRYSDATTSASIAPRPGLMLSITNAYGRSLNFTYNSNGLLATMTDPAGGVYQYAYTDGNAPDNLTSVTYPDGSIRRYVYNESAYLANSSSNPLYPHALTGIIDESGNRYATFSYNADGKAISTEHSNGIDKFSISYSGTNATITNPLNSVATYSYQTIQGLPRLTGQTQPAGIGCGPSARNIDYDANGNITRLTDFNGNTTCYAYDTTRNLETIRVEGLASGSACPTNLSSYQPTAGSSERKISTEWHPTWRLRTRVAEAKRITAWDYSETLDECGALGVVCNHTDYATNDDTGGQGLTAATTAARQWRYQYNPRGQLLVSDGPRDNSDANDQTFYSYYADDDSNSNNRKRLYTVTDSAGHVTTYSQYDANGRPTRVIAANGMITDYLYTARGQIQTLTVAGRSSQFSYDANNQLQQITHPATGSVTYSYDAAHRLTDITDAVGDKLHYSLDNAGHRTQVLTLAQGATTPSRIINQRFDALGRLWQTLNAANQVLHEHNYDAQGNLRRTLDNFSDTEQAITDYHGYDTLNRLTQVTDALNGEVSHQYDAQDHLTQVTDARNNSTRYSTDGLDNQLSETSPDRGNTFNQSYDPAGNVKTRIDARGAAAFYRYDHINRLISASYQMLPGGPPNSLDVTFNYRYDGNPNPSNNNAVGRLSHSDDTTGATDWSYDNEGRLLSKNQRTNAINLISRYDYDPNSSRVHSFTYPSGATLYYDYDAAGRISALHYAVDAQSNAQTLLDTVSYQPLGAMQSYRLPQVTGQPSISRDIDQDGHITRYHLNDSDIELSRDWQGNIISRTSVNDSQSYSYDLLSRLTDSHTTTSYQHYDYDANSNRTQKTVDSNTTNYQVASNSNRLNSIASNAQSYDATGNLTGNGALQYSYDAAGRLVQAQTSTSLYRYGVNAHGQRVSKTGPAYLMPTPSTYYLYDESGHLIGEYDTGGARIQEHIWLNDQPIAVIDASSNVYYVLSDHLNTPRQIIDTNQQLRWRWDATDPFGANLANDNPSALGSFTYNLRFPGQYFDSETGLHYNYFRDYDPGSGRYVQSDPIGLLGGINTYTYVTNNPLFFSDPTGESAAVVGGVLIGTGLFIAAASYNPDLVNSAIQRITKLCSNDDEEDPCDQIREDIRDLVGLLKKRRRHMEEDRDHLFETRPSGPHSWAGHRKKYLEVQDQLKEKIDEAKALGCAYDPEADLWAIKGPPSRPDRYK